MALFMLERYLPAAFHTAADELGRKACELLRLGGADVQYVETLVLIVDETAFVLLEAETIEAVRRAAEEVALGYDRVVEARLHRAARERQ